MTDGRPNEEETFAGETRSTEWASGTEHILFCEPMDCPEANAKNHLHAQSGCAILWCENVPVAQLDRVPDYGSGGCRFESCQVRHPLRTGATVRLPVFPHQNESPARRPHVNGAPISARNPDWPFGYSKATGTYSVSKALFTQTSRNAFSMRKPARRLTNV